MVRVQAAALEERSNLRLAAPDFLYSTIDLPFRPWTGCTRGKRSAVFRSKSRPPEGAEGVGVDDLGPDVGINNPTNSSRERCGGSTSAIPRHDLRDQPSAVMRCASNAFTSLGASP